MTNESVCLRKPCCRSKNIAALMSTKSMAKLSFLIPLESLHAAFSSSRSTGYHESDVGSRKFIFSRHFPRFDWPKFGRTIEEQSESLHGSWLLIFLCKPQHTVALFHFMCSSCTIVSKLIRVYAQEHTTLSLKIFQLRRQIGIWAKLDDLKETC